MSIDNLVPSQLEEVATSSTDDVMNAEQLPQQSTDEADTTVEHVSENGVDQNDDGQNRDKDSTQRRINTLVAERNIYKDELTAIKGQLEDIQTQVTDSKPKTLRDYDVETLRNFVKVNDGNDEYQANVDEARDLIQEKLMDERFSKFETKQTQNVADEQGLNLSYQISTAIAGKDLEDQNSTLYKTAEAKYAELAKPEYNNVDLKMLLASALARLETGSTSQSPSIQDRLERNKSARIEGAGRSSTGGDESIKDMLKKSTRLDVSTQGEIRSLGKMVRQLNVVKSLEQ